MARKSKESLLRKTLMANTVFTTVCGLVMVIASSALASLMGAISGGVLLVTGLILLLYAVDLGRTAFAEQLPPVRIYYFIVMDVLWVIGSALLLWGFGLPFTQTGQWIILLVADAVGLFGLFQYIGLRRLTKADTKAAPTV